MTIRTWSIVVCTVLAVDAVCALWLLTWQHELHGMVNGSRSDVIVQDPAARVETLLDALRFLTVATAVLFLLWFQRVRDETEKRLPGRRANGGRSWALWWWIIPVVNYWQPLRISLDIWSANRRPEVRSRLPRWLPVTGWWVLLLLGLHRFSESDRIFDEYRYDLWTPDAQPGMFRSALETGMWANAPYLAALAATAAFVLALTRMQERGAEPAAAVRSPEAQPA